jgi:tripartite-type tricarboxylate transporter receptor subunit TctC
MAKLAMKQLGVSHISNTLKVFGLTFIISFSTATAASDNAAPQAVTAFGSEKFTIIAPFPPGGPVDLLARLLADGLGKKYKQPATVENIPGAAGNIGMEKVKRAKAGGHTLLLIPAGNLTINPTLMSNFPFNVEKDFVAVSMLAKAPNVMVANAGVKVKNVNEFVALAKAKPGGFAFASPGIGSGLHLAGELFKQQAGVDLLHIPYKGTAPALNDVIGEQIAVMFSNLPGALPHIKSGKLIALGITDTVRSSAAPDIPTLAEQGINGVVVTSWYGLMAPAGTSKVMAEQIAADAAEILSRPATRDLLKAQGLVEVLMKPGEFDAHIRNETAAWAKVIKSKNITLE